MCFWSSLVYFLNKQAMLNAILFGDLLTKCYFIKLRCIKVEYIYPFFFFISKPTDGAVKCTMILVFLYGTLQKLRYGRTFRHRLKYRIC